MKTRDELIDAVEKHATDHYTDGGWDYIAEAYDRDELAELIGDADTVEAAIAKAAEVAELLAER